MTQRADPETLETDGVAAWRPDVGDVAAQRSVAAAIGIELVRRARRGDADAFDQLVRQRLDRAFRLAVAILRSELDARDAVQDAFVSAWLRLPSLRDPTRFDAWLDRIVINACRMALRHRRVVRVREIDVDDPATDAAEIIDGITEGPDTHLAESDLVRRALAHLDPEKRVLLVLHHVDDRPLDEIATLLDVPIGTVKWRLHEARAALERALEEETR